MARLVLGLQPAREAIRVHGAKLERVLVERDGPKLEAVARFAKDHGAAVERVGRAELDRIAAGGKHQGVAVLAPELHIHSLDELALDEHTVVVALDGVMDPQNFGAVVRSAVALGATAILWGEHGSAPLTPATFRASAGAIEHAVLCRVPSLHGAIEALEDRGVPSVLLDAQGTVELGDVPLAGPVAIVIGAEDRGARPAVRRACRTIARLPMAGPIASLNASVAGAIALYEVARQRRRAPAARSTEG